MSRPWNHASSGSGSGKLQFCTAKGLRTIGAGGAAIYLLVIIRSCFIFQHSLSAGEAFLPRERSGVDAVPGPDGIRSRRAGNIEIVSLVPLINSSSPRYSNTNVARDQAGRRADKAFEQHFRGNGTRADADERMELMEQQMALMKRWMDKRNNETASTDALLLRWLRHHRNETSKNATSPHQLLPSPVFFAPGSLPLSRAATLQQCYTDPAVFEHHMKYPGAKRRASYSAEHRLAYIMLPKSGSSTARHVMKHALGASESVVDVNPPLDAFTFVRDPLERFYSQYDEAFLRTAPWRRIENPYHIDPATGKGTPHPFPFLYDGMRTYGDYEHVFCPGHEACDRSRTRENGTLAARLARFAREWDGRVPHDVHLSLQTPLLSTLTGRALPVARLYDSSDPERGWEEMPRDFFGGEEGSVAGRIRGVIAGGVRLMSRPRRFDVSLLGEETRRRICELTLLDYCCLNFPLPEVCGGGGRERSGEGGATGSGRLVCKMDYDKHKRIRIQPGTVPT